MRIVLIVVALLAARNVVGESILPPPLYVPVNLLAVALLALVARASGLSAAEIGLARPTWRHGLVVGTAVAGIVAAGIALAAVTPPTRPWFEDQRMADVDSAAGLGYQALVRIPLGTALLEEVAFRGVLLALLARVCSIASAVLASSLLFGLWHIRPTLGALAANDLAAGALARGGAVAAAVALTAIGGVVFCCLREASDSLLAPWLVHAATNSAATVAAYAVLQG